jgi:hypothetical protein
MISVENELMAFLLFQSSTYLGVKIKKQIDWLRVLLGIDKFMRFSTTVLPMMLIGEKK